MNTKQLRQKILDLAIRGKLVPQDPNDEPASVLLERIRAEKESLIKAKKIKPDKKESGADKSPYRNLPFEAPEGWVWCNLENIAFLKAGSFVKADDICKDYQDNLFPCYGGNGLRGYVKTYTHEGLYSLIGRQGALCGNVNIAKGRFHATEHAIVTFLYGDIDILWLYYTLKALNLNQYSIGAAQPGLSVERINKVLCPLPPLAEQRRIVSVIESAFALIDEIDESKASLQQIIKQAKAKTLDLAIRGKLVPQEKSSTTAKPTADNSPYPDLPNGWTVTEMQKVCFLSDGEKISEKELPYLEAKYFRKRGEVTYCNSGKFVPKNSTVILVDGENSGELFSVEEDGYQGSTFKILNVTNNVDKNYIFKVLQKEQATFRESKVGSAIPHLNKKLFRELIVWLPPLSEQKRIVERIETIFKSLDYIQDNL